MHHALVPFNLPDEHEQYVIDTLVTTSLNGIDTHGVQLLETYIRELQGGRCKPRPNLAFTSTAPATGILDADDALGVVAANEAIKRAVALARQSGVSAISVTNSNHCGAAGYYATLAARSGMIGLVFTNSDALVAPFNGLIALNGTNPIAMSAPGLGDEVFSLDASTSQTSFLKALRAASADGESISGDSREKALREPLKPLGGYKGQGLGMMVQIFGAVLTGMPFDHQLSNMYDAPYNKGRKIGHSFICLDINTFMPLASFRARLSELLHIFRNSPPADPSSPVIVPGDAERRAHEKRVNEGLPLSDNVWTFMEPHVEAVRYSG